MMGDDVERTKNEGSSSRVIDYAACPKDVTAPHPDARFFCGFVPEISSGASECRSGVRWSHGFAGRFAHDSPDCDPREGTGQLRGQLTSASLLGERQILSPRSGRDTRPPPSFRRLMNKGAAHRPGLLSQPGGAAPELSANSGRFDRCLHESDLRDRESNDHRERESNGHRESSTRSMIETRESRTTAPLSLRSRSSRPCSADLSGSTVSELSANLRSRGHVL